jgi:hypothetical protein
MKVLSRRHPTKLGQPVGMNEIGLHLGRDAG